MSRYAGRAFESEAEVQEGKGVLMVKGLKSMWRQAPPIVRNTLQGVLARIIMQVCSFSRTPPTRDLLVIACLSFSFDVRRLQLVHALLQDVPVRSCIGAAGMSPAAGCDRGEIMHARRRI
jgi:hypothetical protein